VKSSIPPPVPITSTGEFASLSSFLVEDDTEVIDQEDLETALKRCKRVSGEYTLE
jgi:hypothetical protein